VESGFDVGEAGLGFGVEGADFVEAEGELDDGGEEVCADGVCRDDFAGAGGEEVGAAFGALADHDAEDRGAGVEGAKVFKELRTDEEDDGFLGTGKLACGVGRWGVVDVNFGIIDAARECVFDGHRVICVADKYGLNCVGH